MPWIKTVPLRLRGSGKSIRTELSNLGITSDKEIVTHCQTHHRSGFTYLLGKALDSRKSKPTPALVRVGNDPIRPLKVVCFFVNEPLV